MKKIVITITILVVIAVAIAIVVSSCAPPIDPNETETPSSGWVGWSCGQGTAPERYVDIAAGIVCEITCTGAISCIPGKDSTWPIFR